MTATGQKYKKPPITEAVIEFRFAQSASKAEIEKAARRLKSEYPFSDEENVTEFSFNVANPKIDNPTTQWLGIKLSSLDRADIAILRKTSFICARLAPYEGWAMFRERVERDWKAWTKAAGHLPLARLGMRYINRLDIPTTRNTTSTQLDEYLNVGPRLPPLDEEPISSFGMQVIKSLGVDDLKLILSTGSVLPAPLLDHNSVALDIDISRETNLPQKDADLWVLLDLMRAHKNRVFESCVTYRSRELFAG